MDFPILMYHKIGHPQPGQRYRNLSVTPQLFADQVRWLQGDAAPRLLEEIGHSKRALEDRLGRPVLSFAWPGGVGADSAAQRAMNARCGYRFACRADGGRETCRPGTPWPCDASPSGENIRASPSPGS
jgi:hypothetical protein